MDTKYEANIRMFSQQAWFICMGVCVRVHGRKKYILSPQNKKIALYWVAVATAPKKNRYFRRKKGIWKMRASMEFAAAARTDEGRERERVREHKRTIAALQVQLTAYIKTSLQTCTCICI